jgi:hypothetical protein
MNLESEYRRLAAACLDLAKGAAAFTDKTRLLVIAEAWLDLADRVTRPGGRSAKNPPAGSEHPLITSAFGTEPTSLAARSGQPDDSAPARNT